MNPNVLNIEDNTKLIEGYNERIGYAFDALTKVQDNYYNGYPYSHFELDVLKIEDFITAALPDLLDSLTAPIFLLLLGEINIEKAISLVDTEILGRGGKE